MDKGVNVNYLRRYIHKVTIWHIRIAALGLLVVFVGVGAQLLVNAIASDSGSFNVKVGAYDTRSRMADGNWTHPGACAVNNAQFPFGTVIALYTSDGTLSRQCTAEDTNKALGYNSIELAMPGDYVGALRWGVRTLLAQIVRWGWGSATPPNPLSAPSPGLWAPLQQRQPVRYSHAS